MFVEDEEKRNSTAEAEVSQVSFYWFPLGTVDNHIRIERMHVSRAV